MRETEILMVNSNLKRLVLSMVLFSFFAFVVLACSSGDGMEANSTPEKKLTEFEQELRNLKAVDFNYIFAVKRKDGDAFDSTDRKFMSEKTHGANRRTITRDGKVLFVGTNYKLDEKKFKELKDRFEIEDFSKTEEQIEKERQEANTNSNVNAANTNEANQPTN